jgi:hypothetical protein
MYTTTGSLRFPIRDPPSTPSVRIMLVLNGSQKDIGAVKAADAAFICAESATLSTAGDHAAMGGRRASTHLAPLADLASYRMSGPCVCQLAIRHRNPSQTAPSSHRSMITAFSRMKGRPVFALSVQPFASSTVAAGSACDRNQTSRKDQTGVGPFRAHPCRTHSRHGRPASWACSRSEGTTLFAGQGW